MGPTLNEESALSDKIAVSQIDDTVPNNVQLSNRDNVAFLFTQPFDKKCHWPFDSPLSLVERSLKGKSQVSNIEY